MATTKQVKVGDRITIDGEAVYSFSGSGEYHRTIRTKAKMIVTRVSDKSITFEFTESGKVERFIHKHGFAFYVKSNDSTQAYWKKQIKHVPAHWEKYNNAKRGDSYRFIHEKNMETVIKIHR